MEMEKKNYERYNRSERKQVFASNSKFQILRKCSKIKSIISAEFFANVGGHPPAMKTIKFSNQKKKKKNVQNVKN